VAPLDEEIVVIKISELLKDTADWQVIFDDPRYYDFKFNAYQADKKANPKKYAAIGNRIADKIAEKMGWNKSSNDNLDDYDNDLIY